MSGEEAIINKVASSGLLTINLDDWLQEKQFDQIDLLPWLWQGLALKEKDFREHIARFDWSSFRGKAVAVFCSSDAIIPTWAFMLVASALSDFTNDVYFGSREEMIEKVLLDKISSIRVEDYHDGRVIIKGCSSVALSPQVYMALVVKLKPHVRSMMFGEPCSTVPVYKRKNL